MYPKNMSFYHFLKSYFSYVMFYVNAVLRYFRYFDNALEIILAVKKNRFPINVRLKNGKHIVVSDQFHLGAISSGFNDQYKNENNIIVIKKDGFPEVKFMDAIKNGDIATVYFNEEYSWMNVKEKIVIDVGANIGDSAIYFSIKGAKKVIAIEPFLKNYESAKKNIIMNHLENKIDLKLAGCSGKNGFINIKKDVASPRAQILDKKGGKEIPLISLSKLVEPFENDSLVLKMDCEGCEYDAILNTDDSILGKFDSIFVEYHYGYQNIIKKLKSCGFKIKLIEPVFHNNPYSNPKKMYIGDICAFK